MRYNTNLPTIHIYRNIKSNILRPVKFTTIDKSNLKVINNLLF